MTCKNYDITDVDLWLYVRTTSLGAERACVDVKRRRTPQAMERVLWTKGLKEVLGVDRAIVVTSDNRRETREFGAAHGVGILQGEFLQRVITTFSPSDRLTEEELFSLLKTPCIVESDVEWRSWFRRAKANLLDSLSFDGCNTFLLAAELLLDEYLAMGKSVEVPIRLLYAIIAYFLICLDYVSHSFVHLNAAARTAGLIDGFRYGEIGPHRTEEIVEMALQLLSAAGKTDLFSGEALYAEFQRQVSEYPAEMLGEHFAKTESLKSLFGIACSYEKQAYSKTLLRPDELPSEQKAVIGLICDFLGRDRKKII